MKDLKEIIELLDVSIKEDSNNNVLWWWIIKEWFDNVVDEYRNLVENSHEWLNNYTQELSRQTNISTLKIKYTNSAGYFIEVPISQKSKIPDNFILKTTLVNAIRFTTKELEDFQEKLLTAEEVLYKREYDKFKEVSNTILEKFKSIKDYWTKIWNLDFLSNLWTIALENNYSKPSIVDKYELEIVWWRHPVIETIQNNFISNELFLSEKNYVNIITWPNMWWKSTYLRQNALIILMSHIWSFVPAKNAIIPLTDKVFSRVWASDNLYLWNSTFMVEMQEVANILNNSTNKSFVIIDEVWRGTSTYDGMSLAWSILKYNHDEIKAKTLFATHYHELSDKSRGLKWVKNFSVAVWENDENLVFLRKIIPGSIKKSYGIEVARMAWLPIDVINEANNFLINFESSPSNQLSLWLSSWIKTVEKIVYKEKESEVEEILKSIDVNSLTPIEALNLIYNLKNKWKKQ